jgi:hypothetical protein
MLQDRTVPKREELSRIWCPLTVELHDDLVVSDEDNRRHVDHTQGGRERLLVLSVQFDDLRQMSQSESETCLLAEMKFKPPGMSPTKSVN